MSYFKKADSALVECRKRRDYPGYLSGKRMRINKSAFDKYRFRFIERILGAKRNGNIIDIGCGCTPLADLYKKNLSPVFFCDHDFFSLQAGRSADDNSHAGPNFICADIRNLPFKDDHFDTLVCLEVIEHLPREDHKALIGEILRIARRGARIFISTPNKYSLPGLEGRFLETFVKSYKWNAWDDTHKYIYSAGEFISLFKNFDVGLKRISGFYFLPGSALVRLPLFVQRLLGYISYLVGASLGGIFPLRYLGFTIIIEIKKQ